MSGSLSVSLLIIYTALSTQHWGYLTPNIRAPQGFPIPARGHC